MCKVMACEWGYVIGFGAQLFGVLATIELINNSKQEINVPQIQR